MAVLLFKHRGWEVATAGWSAGSKDGRSIEICYQWGADALSFTSTGPGNARTTLNISMADFVKRLSRSGGVVDLRDVP